MFSQKYSGKSILILITVMSIFLFNNINALASENPAKYVLVYDQLYEYAENSSDILRQYMELKSTDKNVLLLQADKLDTKKIGKNSTIIIATSSFESKEKYHRILALFNNFKVITLDNELISTGAKTKKAGLMIAIDKVYPFSDFNKLMNMAEKLHNRGINFILTVMPVYENYELEAFDTYVSVLKYISKIGGHLFVHYPVENENGTYNLDPGIGLKKAVGEFRKRGLEVKGITLSQDKLFTNTKVFEGLNLPYILVTAREGKIDANMDLFKTSQILDDYIIINGVNINSFNVFHYKEKEYPVGHHSVYISTGDDEKKIFNLLKILNTEKITIRNFSVGDYYDRLKNFNYIQTGDTDFVEKKKSQLEEFKAEEMKKIRGENIEDEQTIEGYDISWFAKTGIRITFVLFVLLIIQILIGRHFEIKKFFRD